eukprot:g45135.t1
MPFAPAWDNNNDTFCVVRLSHIQFGFVEFAEKWNGRMAMLDFRSGILYYCTILRLGRTQPNFGYSRQT